MVQVAPVRLQVGPKVLWFDPNGLEIHANDAVVVNTKRGREYGVATSELLEVSDQLVADLKSPLQKVLRVATPEDEAQAAAMEAAGNEALGVFRQMVEETGLDMRPVLVEYLFDGEKAVFYFESEQRVDFRDLVRKLAAHFHVRVDMRQIGVRDAARIIGGLGHCGQELCCKRMGGEFSPVMMRMAKEQNLSLNQPKISGVCGRLMCCLRYEYDVYKEFNSHAPKLGTKVETSEGPAKVVEVNVPAESITLLVGGDKRVRIPLDEFEPPEEGSNRPKKISEEVFERYVNADAVARAESLSLVVEHGRFDEEAKLADPNARTSRLDGRTVDEVEREGGKRRRRRRSGSEGKGSSDAAKGRSKRGQGKGEGGKSEGKGEGSRRSRRGSGSGSGSGKKGFGQVSGRGSQRGSEEGSRERRPGSADARRKPRRTHSASSAGMPGEGAEAKRSGARPGQRSSGLSAGARAERGSAASGGQQRQGAKQETGAQGGRNGRDGNAAKGRSHRKPRNRSHSGNGSGNGGGQGGGESAGGTNPRFDARQ